MLSLAHYNSFSMMRHCLLDRWFTLSFVTPYVVLCFGFCPESILDPFSVSTPVGESVVAKKIYRDCVVSI